MYFSGIYGKIDSIFSKGVSLVDSKNMFIIGAIIILGIGLLIAFYHYRRRNLENLFAQVYESAKQVPKKKKNSFLLLMFKESLSASKKKSDTGSISNKLNNPKYLEIQLVQMSQILKNPSKVKDKTIKRALILLEDYKKWEKNKNSNHTDTKK